LKNGTIFVHAGSSSAADVVKIGRIIAMMKANSFMAGKRGNAANVFKVLVGKC
jgi:hypothetical protein